MIPFVSIATPAGGFNNMYDRLFAGMSASMAELVTVSRVSSAIVRSGWAGKIGALFTSLTVTRKLFVALRGGLPSSVTTVVIVYTPGPCSSVGVQVMIPLVSIREAVGGLMRI